MDSESLIYFAKTALVRVAGIATVLSMENRKPQWSRFGAALLLIEISDEFPRKESRIRKLLRDIERMCSLSANPDKDKTPLLQALVWADAGSLVYQGTVNSIRLGLQHRTLMHESTLEAAIQHLNKYDRATSAKWQENDDADELLAAMGAPTRYPKEIDALICKLLRNQMCCTCGNRAGQTIEAKHLTQLMLWHPFTQTPEPGQLLLAMLFSSSPVHTESHLRRWQNVELHFSWSKRARFSDQRRGFSTFPPSRQTMETDQKQFCELLGLYPDSRVRFLIENGEVQESKPLKPLEPVVEHTPGISLAQLLRLYSLTSRMRVALAYILAYSVWQYYDSDWVNSRWTSESIQFLKELDNSSAGTEGKLYAWKPYLCARFGDEEPGLPEYSITNDKMHRYPRVLALGILLVEIGIGAPLDPILQGSLADESDEAWLWAVKISQDKEKWKGFDYPKYLTAVKSCLNPQNFFSTVRDGDTPGNINDLTRRRGVLYQKVVAPLEDLLEKTGWMEELTKTGPVDTSAEKHIELTAGRREFKCLTRDFQDSSGPKAKMLTVTRSQRDAKRWLRRMNTLSRSLAPSQNSGTPIRIAILDTGCNIGSTFCSFPQNFYRLKGWRDFVSGSGEWLDCDGHGTYLISLMMKIDPMAEIYVARIAESTQDLIQASENVAKAISWATEEWGVDIISMSFGYTQDEQCISNAIYEAISYRDGSILFFAAASNAGANEREMFPARHECVISIRATNCNGNFLDLNPPRSQHDGVVFGTLGLDVASEPDEYGEIKYESGTSVATAIAASIASVLLGFVSGGSSKESFKEVSRKLRTRQGMQALFRSLAVAIQHEQLYIAPWRLQEQPDSIRWSIIEAALLGF